MHVLIFDLSARIRKSRSSRARWGHGMSERGLSLVLLRRELISSAYSRCQWYYEAQVMTPGYLAVGWCYPHYLPDCMEGNGIGDDTDSFAFCGKFQWATKTLGSCGTHSMLGASVMIVAKGSCGSE